ncbi:MAG: hypothetical protein ABI036_07745 [Fibrobacteria bacterium]
MASSIRRSVKSPLTAHVAVAILIMVMAAAAATAADGKKTRTLKLSDAAKSESVGAPDLPIGKPGTGTGKDTGQAAPKFEELKFNRTLVIEGKVEKPAVQFTLLKEPPPEKEILFETSFRKQILKLDRENTFSPGETYGRE